MDINFEQYLNIEKEAFDDFDYYGSQLEKIEKANEIGKKVLSFIDSEIEIFNKDNFNNININEIIYDLNINVNKNIESEVLTEIYSEIENTFNNGGRVSLEEYLNQGNTIYKDIQNKLKGEVDYNIKYSEEELKEEEENAFNRFCYVLSIKNKRELSECLNLSKDCKELLNKENQYLDILDGIPYAESIEEKIEDLNSLFIGLKHMNNLGSKIVDDININNIITNKIKNMTMELSEYSKDINIQNRFLNLEKNIEMISNQNPDLKDIALHSIEKLEIINEAIYYKDLELEHNDSLDL